MATARPLLRSPTRPARGRAMDTQTAILMIVVLLVVGALVWMLFARRRTHDLRERFGPEYERQIHEHGSARRAEAELDRRARRVERLHLQPLPPTERTRYAELWSQERGACVDDPPGAVDGADQLVEEVMRRRGYPVGDFEQRAADISVDHPQVVENYRAAHEIALLLEHGRARTEDLRKAMVHYRALFEELLDDRLAEARG